MGKFNDLTGRVFVRATVVSRAGSNEFKKALWACRCICGVEFIAIGSTLLDGRTKSCGCWRAEGNCRVSHGARRVKNTTRAYRAWSNMKNRCESPTTPQWKDYGGRGITVAPEWEQFEAFLSDMGEPPPGMTLDREDNDGDYRPGNCRWATRVAQRRNSRNHMVEVDIEGEKMILTDAVRKLKIVSYRTAVSRIHRGWAPLQAVITPYTRSDNKGYRP